MELLRRVLKLKVLTKHISDVGEKDTKIAMALCFARVGRLLVHPKVAERID